MKRPAPVAECQPKRPLSLALLKSRWRPAPSDERLCLFVTWWRRMHRKRRGLRAVRLLVMARRSDQKAAVERSALEVCKWPTCRGGNWVLVSWQIDGAGMWLKEFATKEAALTVFRSLLPG